ncbi:MAG: arsenic metallochaperone ArsD family protein [Crocosphaera sp.]
MKKVYIYDKSCCHSGSIEQLSSFIQEQLNTQVEVKTFNLAEPNQSVPIPFALFTKIQKDGSKCLPAIVVDNSVVALGKLPKLEDALEMVQTGQPIQKSVQPIPESCNCSCSNQASCC